MMAAFKHDPQVSTDARKRLFELVDAADPDRRAGDFRVRDSYLMELGLLGDVTSKRWILRCRQRIRNPTVKRELTTHLESLKRRGTLQPSRIPTWLPDSGDVDASACTRTAVRRPPRRAGAPIHVCSRRSSGRHRGGGSAGRRACVRQG